MTKKIEKIPLEQSPLYNLSSKAKLAHLLGCRTQFLHNFRNSRRQYNIFKIKKTNGTGKRPVEDPNIFLKRLHSKFKNLITEIQTPDYLHSGTKGKSHITNAQSHIEAKYCVTLDLKSFYQNARKTFLRYMFHTVFQMPDDIAYCVADIATIPYRPSDEHNSYFSTGSPLSQILIFWCYKGTFDYTDRLARKKGIIFTLYVDDMTFSSNTPIPQNFINSVEKRLEKVGLRLNKEKTKKYTPKEFKIITGCAIKNGTMKAKNCKREEIIVKLKQNDNSFRTIASIVGKIASQQQIEPNILNASKQQLIARRKKLAKR
jgi:hypothetical protein